MSILIDNEYCYWPELSGSKAGERMPSVERKGTVTNAVNVARSKLAIPRFTCTIRLALD
jgi:hypothetical protein